MEILLYYFIAAEVGIANYIQRVSAITVLSYEMSAEAPHVHLDICADDRTLTGPITTCSRMKYQV